MGLHNMFFLKKIMDAHHHERKNFYFFLTKVLLLSSCCQGKGTSATPPFPHVAMSVLDSSLSPLIFLVSFFWALNEGLLCRNKK